MARVTARAKLAEDTSTRSPQIHAEATHAQGFICIYIFIGVATFASQIGSILASMSRYNEVKNWKQLLKDVCGTLRGPDGLLRLSLAALCNMIDRSDPTSEPGYSNAHDRIAGRIPIGRTDSRSDEKTA
jgi:hypothetical protein